MSDWHTCDVCEAEYKVVTALNSVPQYCPFCGTETDMTEEDDWNDDAEQLDDEIEEE